MMQNLRRAACALAVVLVPAGAGAQNISAQPVYGTLNLSAGFTPDPQRVQLAAGGGDRVSLGGCTTYINGRAPDVDLNYSAGGYALTISAESSSDVMLLVNTPDGNWHCNDDGGDGLDPVLRFSSPQSGQYNIWVGTYRDNDGDLPSATLLVSEVGAGSSSSASSSSSRGSGSSPNWAADPTYGTIDLSSGFSPDPYTRSIRAGGSDEVNVSGSGSCRGYIHAGAPDLDLNYTAGSYELNIYAKSSTDVTLVVNQPDGTWICSDDANGTNPHIELNNPQSGNYNIWIGTYRATSDLPESVLYISELSPRW